MTEQAPHEGMISAEYSGLIVWHWPDYIPPPKTPPEVAAETIDRLEQESLMNRITRETLITLAEDRGKALGLTVAQLKIKNKGYAALKALDDQIIELRSLL